MKFSTIAMILSLALLVSCNDKSKSSKKTTQYRLESNLGNNDSSATPEGTTQPETNSSLSVFMSDCRFDSDEKLYRRSSLRINKQDGFSDIKLVDSFSADKTCTNLELSIEFPLENINEEDESMYSGYADKVYYRPRSQRVAEEFRNSNTCETDNWNLAVATEVTGTSCAELGMNSQVNIKITKNSAAVTVCDQDDNTCETFTLRKR